MRKTNKSKSKKVAYLFNEGGPSSAAVLGGKGAGLVELARHGMPVPASFTITTAVARAYAQHGRLPKRSQWQINWGMEGLERESGKSFGDAHNPLLVSVRSGAPVSMPGMMDTVLNLGINPQIASALALQTGARFAWDTYRRFLYMFGTVVLGINKEKFDSVKEAKFHNKEGKRYEHADGDALNGDVLREICSLYRSLIETETRQAVPDEPRRQLDLAVEAVLKSWNSERAVTYRRLNKISDDLGTAVNVQVMVYGNRDSQSGSGVVFSRNVAVGTRGMWGEFLLNAQGEDVVSGSHTPLPIALMKSWNAAVFTELSDYVEKLERTRREVVDVEFTVESGKLYILQVRAAKLTPEAAATCAVHFVWDGWRAKEEALAGVSHEQCVALQARSFEPEAFARAFAERKIGQGISASPGAVVGALVKTSAEAVREAATGRAVILVRPDTSPEDLEGMMAAAAIVTLTGGATSHAAVVARSLSKAAVVGCSALNLDHYPSGTLIAVDGGSGEVVLGAVPMVEIPRKKEINLLLRWLSEREAQRWPKPKLVFQHVSESVKLERLLVDFYLTDFMARDAVGTTLEYEAAALRRDVHAHTAERLVMYLVVAVGGEIRHADSFSYICDENLDMLKKEFAVELGGRRGDAQLRTLAKLKTLSHEEHVRFMKLCQEQFFNGTWASSIGGSAWGLIARAAHDFLIGKLTASVFADHAFDLEHNNGSVFGKHLMVTGDRYAVKHYLNEKKVASSVPILYRRLAARVQDYTLQMARLCDCSPRVEALYRKGERLRTWKQV